MIITDLRFIKSMRRGTSVRPLVNSPINEVVGDVLSPLNSLIPIAEPIYFGSWEAPLNICDQLRDANVRRDEILVLVKGGGDIESHAFANIYTKFTAVNVQFIKSVLACHIGVAIGHHHTKYHLPVHDYADFWADTPGQLGILVNELFELVIEDPAIFAKYAKKVEAPMDTEAHLLSLEAPSH